MPRSSPALLLAPVMSLLFTPPAASGQTARAVGAPLRDSAEVRIAEHRAIPTTLPTWRLASTPDVRIGAVEGRGPTVFGEISGLLERRDGSIVVADARSFELRAFSAAGEHLWSSGRSGAGPGEFQSLTTVLALPGDSLLVLPRSGRGVPQVFDGTGRYGRSLRLESPAPAVATAPTVLGTLEDGTLVASMGVRGPTRDGRRGRGWISVVLLDPEGNLRGSLGTYPARETASRQVSLLGRTVSVAPIRLPAGRETVVTVGSQTLVIGDQDRFELHFHGTGGALESIVRVAAPPPRLDRARYEAHVREHCRTRGCFELEDLPATLPAFGRMMMDPADRVWVEEFVPEYESRAPLWWVIAPDGAFLARIGFPTGFTPHRIGLDHVLGVRSDPLGVEYVERYAIRRD